MRTSGYRLTRLLLRVFATQNTYMHATHASAQILNKAHTCVQNMQHMHACICADCTASHLNLVYFALCVVAQPTRKFIPAGVTQHHSILRCEVSCDLQDARRKEGLLLVPHCCHCSTVQPQLTLHRHTQYPSLPVSAKTTKNGHDCCMNNYL